jgi:dihydrofolate reductase/thymidylate synthase
MRIQLIFATDKQGLFGLNNRIPWTCETDMKHFYRTTMDTFEETTLVMGSKTFTSLTRKLEGRKHVVLSSSSIPAADATFASFEAFLDSEPKGRVFVIGGAKLLEEVYRRHTPLIDTIWYSEIQTSVKTIPEDTTVFLNSEFLNEIRSLPKETKETEAVHFHKITPKRHEEYQYLDVLGQCLTQKERETRNGVTQSLFHADMTFDLTKGFPLLTTKKVFLRGIFEELLFFLKGQTDSKILEAKQVNIWKPNTTKEFLTRSNLPYEEGDMGPMYGWNWKHFGATYKDCKTDYAGQGYDQIQYVMDLLQNDPHSRRILLTTYNPAQAKAGVLYPCHSIVVQFYAEGDKEAGYDVSLSMYQRSVDMACGLPFNIASNALLLHIVCQTLQKRTDIAYRPHKLHLTLGDVHVYQAHREGVLEQLKRTPHPFPTLKFKQTHEDLESYVFEDVELVEYKSYPAISYKMVA